VKEKHIVLQAVSITAGQFSNEKLTELFLEYHRGKARFLLVHAKANLSTLKLSPSMGPCDICGRTTYHLTWVFKSGLCKKCMKSESFFAKFCSQKYACRAFCLAPAELSMLQFESLPNPKNSGFAPMKLFKMGDIHRAATEKHGSVDKALEKWTIRKDRASRTRQSHYDAAASFAMALRRPRKILKIQEDPFSADSACLATPAQIRYLMQLGAPRYAGTMSKSFASKLIRKYKKRT
jgi:hypothetical protein